MQELQVSEVLTFLGTLKIEDMMAGLPIDWAKVPDKTLALKLAIHCAINGPVSVNKSSSFPGVEGEKMIKQCLGDNRVSNNSWAETVRVVAKAINERFPNLDCPRRRAAKDLWPLYVVKVMTSSA